MREIVDIDDKRESTVRLFVGPASLGQRFLRLAVAKTAHTIREQWQLSMVVVFAAAYTATFSYLSIAKYNSFNAAVGDLGLHNQLYWLLLSGGPSAYNAHGFDQWYPFPWAKPTLFLVLPFYALYPRPETLLVVQSAALGFTALPLYFLCKRYIRNGTFCLVVSSLYLMYFPMQGANLFDFHIESLFPLLFVFSILFWHSEKRFLFGLCLSLAALVGPGGLLTCAIFLTYAIWRETRFHLALSTLRDLLHSLRTHRLEAALMVGLFAVFILQVFVGSIGPYLSRANPAIPANIADNINVKLEYFVLLLAPLGFVALWDRLAVLLAIPFLANAVLTTSSAFWNPFVLHYPLMVLPILLLGTIRGAAVICKSGRSIDEERLRNLAGILLSLSVIFALVYSPVGPLNSNVEGGYFRGNHNLAEITFVSDHDRFVGRLLSLIPPGASVLTENDIPQVSGRPGFYVVLPGTPLPPPPSSGLYDYIVADATVQYFAPFEAILPYLSAALADNSFGILAIGQGAVLLQRSFVGEPLLFEPFNRTWTPDELSLFSGMRTEELLVHPASAGNSFSFWFGPYAVLPPGQYSARFSLQVEGLVPPDARIITLQVASDFGNRLWTSQDITLGQFSSARSWQTFTLNFSLSEFVTGVELRGMFVTSATTISLQTVSLVQNSVG